jgi:hypothetical protein
MAQHTNRLERTKERSEAAEAARQPVNDLMDYLRDYARENPEMTALWCFGIGFVLGWKLKPW